MTDKYNATDEGSKIRAGQEYIMETEKIATSQDEYWN